MLRSGIIASLLAFALANVAAAQVVYTNGGYATTDSAVVDAQGAPSVPAINTPFAHVGPEAPPQTDQSQQITPETASSNNNASGEPVKLGAAQIEVNQFVNGSDANDRPLGEVAREMKQQAQPANAKTFTNADIQKLNQSGTSNNPSVPNAKGNDEWPANNGVVTPEPNNPQGVTAAPSQNQRPTGMSPFAPRSQGQPETQPPPQANAKPSAGSPYEMAQNNPANAGIPQQDNQASSSNSDHASATTLPKTASRLPLLGVLGFFTVAMGLFVRYQRGKEAK